jgi:hypothetical protein
MMMHVLIPLQDIFVMIIRLKKVANLISLKMIVSKMENVFWDVHLLLHMDLLQDVTVMAIVKQLFLVC